MNWDALGAIAELFGALAVLATLVYLARQISLSSKVANAHAWRDSIVAWEQATAEMIRNSHLLSAAMDNVDTVSDEAEFDRMMSLVNKFQQAHYVLWRMAQLDQIPLQEMRGYDANICMLLKTSLGRRFWSATKNNWVPDYQDHIHSIVSSYNGPAWHSFVASIRQGDFDDA